MQSICLENSPPQTPPLTVRKLAYITSMATGGLAGFNYKELVEMQRLGLDVGLYVTKFKQGPYMAPAGIPTFRVQPGPLVANQTLGLLRNPKLYFSLMAEALRTRTAHDLLIALQWVPSMIESGRDWIHCHWGDHKLYIGYYCHRLTGIPLSVTLHGYDLYANPNWVMFERSLRACAQIITISDYNKKLLIKRFGELGERIKVIRLFTEFIEESQSLNRLVKILIVGGFHHRKGYDVLLQALHKLNRPDIRLWIVGYKGPVDVRKMISDLNLKDRVTLFGHVNDDVLKVLYSTCDIFAMPSRIDSYGVGEGLPVALMEAMSYEKPIVSTLHTGIPELVPDILVPENDVDGLAQGIARLADDPELRLSMGKRNRKIVMEQYSSENVQSLLNALKKEE